MSIRDARRTTVSELFDDAWADRGSVRLLTRRFERLGVDLCRPYQIVCLRESAHQPRRAIFAPLEDFLGEIGPGHGRV